MGFYEDKLDLKVYRKLRSSSLLAFNMHCKDKLFTDEEAEDIASLYFSSQYFNHSTIIYWEGLRNPLHNKSSHMRDRMNYTPMIPPLLDVYTTEELETMKTGDALLGEFSSVQKEKIMVKRAIGLLIPEYTDQLKVPTGSISSWDETILFRFYSANAFMGQKEHKTFGDFLEYNLEKVYADFRILKENENKHTEKLYEFFCSNIQISSHFIYSLNSKIDKIVYSLTKEEIIRLLEIAEIAETDDSKLKVELWSLEDTVDYIRNYDTFIYNPEMCVDEVTKIVHKKLKDKGFHESTVYSKRRKSYRWKLVESVTEGAFCNINNPKHQKYAKEIFENIQEYADILSPLEMLTLVAIMKEPKHFLNRAGGRVYEVILKGFEKYGVERFADFIYETVMTYEGELPTYSDWMEQFKSDDDLDSDIPASLTLTMMTRKNRHKSRSLRDIYYLKENIKFIEDCLD